MKKVILTLMLTFAAFCVFAQKTVKERELKEQASQIAQKLKLDSKTERLTYNVLKHVDGRITDLSLGQENYKKLLDYINQERLEMMKVVLTTDKFKTYDKTFSPEMETKMKDLVAKHNDYVKVNGTMKTNVSSDLVLSTPSEESTDSSTDSE